MQHHSTPMTPNCHMRRGATPEDFGYTSWEEARAAVDTEERGRREREARALIQRLGPPDVVRRSFLSLVRDEITDIALAAVLEVLDE